MHQTRFLKLLVLVISITLSHGKKGYHKKCIVNTTADAEKYDRVFVFAGEFKTFLVHKEPWPDTAYELHRLAGRETRSKIIQEGRKALVYFKNKYGIDENHLISDDQIYNGEDVTFANYTFIHEAIDLKPGTYRLIMESKGNRSHYYHNPPEVNEVAFVFVIHREFNAGGTFNKTLYPGDVLLFGDYIIESPKRCSFDNLTVIHNEGTGPIKSYGKDSIVTHVNYGTGTSQVSFVKDDDGITRATNVIRFPAN